MNRSFDDTDEESEGIPLSDSIDHAILMHRDVHFGGKFDFMLDYYEKGGKGTNLDFEMDRIRALAAIELHSAQNLAAVKLTGAEAEKVAEAKTVYKTLRDLYEIEKPVNPFPLLIADLILSEEEDPVKEIEAIVAKKGLMVPYLIDLLRSPHFHDPLFPGYGLTPALAIKCLSKIADKRAIITLFELIGDSDFFNEDLALEALKAIGEPAKEFLLRVLHGRPLNVDNERAAIALAAFNDDPKVSRACLEMLSQSDVQQDPLLCAYLILVCEALPDEEGRQKLLSLAPRLPKMVHQDLKAIEREWKNKTNS